MISNKNLDNLDSNDENFVIEETEAEGVGLSEKLKDLREKLKHCEKEKQEYLSGWQRSKADFINSKKELLSEKENFISFSESALIKDLLPVLSSFSAAMADKKAWEEVPPNWRKGVEYIHTQLIKVLESRGLEIKNPINEKFDPNIHEAVSEEEVGREELSEVILKVLSPAFLQKGRLIQPAKVIVGIFKK